MIGVTIVDRLQVRSQRLAGVLSRWVPGTRDVINGIAVEPDEEDVPIRMEEAVRVSIEKDRLPNASQIKVGVRDRTVGPTGLVAPEAMRTRRRRMPGTCSASTTPGLPFMAGTARQEEGAETQISAGGQPGGAEIRFEVADGMATLNGRLKRHQRNPRQTLKRAAADASEDRVFRCSTIARQARPDSIAGKASNPIPGPRQARCPPPATSDRAT